MIESVKIRLETVPCFQISTAGIKGLFSLKGYCMTKFKRFKSLTTIDNPAKYESGCFELSDISLH